MKNDKKNEPKKPQNPVSEKEFPSDVLGSYTGNPIGDDDVPEQDADDL